jgi:hypothetical protein
MIISCLKTTIIGWLPTMRYQVIGTKQYQSHPIDYLRSSGQMKSRMTMNFQMMSLIDSALLRDNHQPLLEDTSRL